MNHFSRLRPLGYLALSLAAFALAAPAQAAPVKPRAQTPAHSQQNQAPAKAEPQKQQAAATGAMQVATSGDWSVFTAGSGRSKVCYALARPKDRQPASLKRDPGYMFVSFRPAEKINGELAIVVGFPTKEDVGGELTVGTTKYELLSKGKDAWLKSSGEEAGVIAAMHKQSGKMMSVMVQSARGNKSTDRYSLNGFSGALARAKQECKGK